MNQSSGKKPELIKRLWKKSQLLGLPFFFPCLVYRKGFLLNFFQKEQKWRKELETAEKTDHLSWYTLVWWNQENHVARFPGKVSLSWFHFINVYYLLFLVPLLLFLFFFWKGIIHFAISQKTVLQRAIALKINTQEMVCRLQKWTLTILLKQI